MSKVLKTLVLFALVLTTALTGSGLHPSHAQDESVSVIELDPTFAVDWMQLIYDRVYAEGLNPPAASRIYGYAGVTLYEALVNGMPNNSSLAGQVTHLPDLPLPAEGVLDWVTVANHSLYQVMTEILPVNPETEDATREALTQHYEQLKEERKAEVGEGVVSFSTKYAGELSTALLDWIATDGFSDIRALPEYIIPDLGELTWVPTSEGQKAVEPYWGQLRPFMMEFPSACDVPLNMVFDTDPESTFYLQAMEVKETGDDLTDEQKEIALFWLDALKQSGTPAGHWMLIGGLMVGHLGLTLEQTVEMYAMVGMAVADAFISAWETKYRVLLLRPVTYIQSHIRRQWQPFIQTPGFPEYPSGHSVVSEAAAVVLTNLFGTVAYVDDTGLPRDLQPRAFTSFQAAASEAAISRVYGGIHYRAAIENGIQQGSCVGETVYNNLVLNSFRQGE